MIKRLIQEDANSRILVISRLSRLISNIQSAVEEERENSESLTFTTYDELLHLLARCVEPDDESECRSFLRFDRIQFECDEGVSFSRDFIGKGRDKKGQFLSLNDKERKQMDKGCIEPLTLFQGKQSVTSLGIERSCANL